MSDNPAWPKALVDAAINIGGEIEHGAGYVILVWGDGQTKLQVAPADLPLTDLVQLLRNAADGIERRMTVANLSALTAPAPAVAAPMLQDVEPLPVEAANGTARPKRRGWPKGKPRKPPQPEAMQ